jgi:riboflavin kinase / FMN adenylyltransferase
MKIFRGFEGVDNIVNPVVTTGSFDGVHIGHKTILNRLKLLAEKYNGESVLITFDPHPRKVLYPETAGRDLKLINSQEEKLELLDKSGLDNVIIVEFTREFSKTTSEEFVRDYLHKILNAKVVVAGFNHHFGFNQEGDYRQLWSWRDKYCFEAEEIPEQEVQHETVSSTRIRQAIKEGYIQRANAYLDHYYIVIGRPVEYEYKNPLLNARFFELPLTEECKLLPALGVYAVTFVSESLNSKGVAILNQTKEGEKEVLFHLFETGTAILNQKSTLHFHKRIHGSIDLPDHKSAALRITAALDEISELIY